jgi:hypothetical protein
LQAGEGIFIISTGLFYMYNPNSEIFAFVIVSYEAILVFVAFFVPESPNYLHHSKQFGKLREAFGTIAKVNGKEMNMDVKFHGESDSEDDSSVGSERDETHGEQFNAIAEICGSKLILVNLLVVTLFWMQSTFVFYVTGFYIKYFKGDIFFNLVIMGIADTLAYLSKRVLLHFFSSRGSYVICYLGVFIMSFIFQYVKLDESALPFVILGIRYFGSASFALNFYVNHEYFSTNTLATVFAFTNTIGRIAGIFAPIAVEVSPKPLLLCGIFSLIACFFAIYLKKPDNVHNPKEIKDL